MWHVKVEEKCRNQKGKKKTWQTLAQMEDNIKIGLKK